MNKSNSRRLAAVKSLLFPLLDGESTLPARMDRRKWQETKHCILQKIAVRINRLDDSPFNTG
jgi:hypothetical protein